MGYLTNKNSLFKRIKPQKLLVISLGILLIVASIRLIIQVINLPAASKQPVDTFFVLGGSIKREMYISEIAAESPDIPILISTGSDDPCILKLFERNNAPLNQVWLEKCADSTFGNFVFSQPILRRWKARHIQLITSKSHLPRALWMAQIVLGAHGIWVEPNLVPETGVPGNRESIAKTGLDVARALVWALISQIVQPNCSDVVNLPEVNLEQWCQDEFTCERQGNVSPKEICEDFD
ncbi:MAG: YdcF family protein [Cyanobacteria bacterium J06592_8]